MAKRTPKNEVRSAIIAARREELLTIKEWASMTSEHVETVRRRCRTRKQPGAYRSGGQWRIDAAIALQAMRGETAFVVLPEEQFALALSLIQPSGAVVEAGRDLFIMVRNPEATGHGIKK